MSIHIAANIGDIAETIILPGDPLRAKMLSDTFLENPFCFNTLRNMFGYTGTYKNKRISIMGTGMGIPSVLIYVTELIKDYNVKNLIRMGTAGSLNKELEIGSVILAQAASTDSAVNKHIFNGMDFAACADFDLLLAAYNIAKKENYNIKVGNILTSDSFYHYNSEEWKKWAEFGVLAVEMETNALYSIAARYGAKALAILTISDSLVTGKSIPMEERQNNLIEMAKLSLETAVSL